MPRLRSMVVATAFGSGAKKLGQPLPLSNLVEDSNNGRPQAAQAYMPERCSLLRGLVPARSVPCLRITAKVSDGNSLRHSSSGRSIVESGGLVSDGLVMGCSSAIGSIGNRAIV